ncbi:MAG: gamma carbonic anhydrase family protein [Candidatus Krumholzibacteriia bacterium]|nr:gamma carbonic anhydrase family protein [bacterium]
MPVYRLDDHDPAIPDSCWLAPDAQVAGRVRLGERASVWFAAVIRGDVDAITVGEETNLQDGAVLHVDAGFPLRIGARVTVGHRAILHGCTVEDDVLVGMGAVVLNGARIGRGSLIAAGALVREGAEIPPFSLVVGLPAAVKRSLPEEDTLAAHRASAAHYAANAERFRRGLSRKDGEHGGD